jgi:hypothetical protein
MAIKYCEIVYAETVQMQVYKKEMGYTKKRFALLMVFDIFIFILSSLSLDADHWTYNLRKLLIRKLTCPLRLGT